MWEIKELFKIKLAEHPGQNHLRLNCMQLGVKKPAIDTEKGKHAFKSILESFNI